MKKIIEEMESEIRTQTTKVKNMHNMLNHMTKSAIKSGHAADVEAKTKIEETKLERMHNALEAIIAIEA